MGDYDDEKTGMWLARFWQGLTGAGVNGGDVTRPIREGQGETNMELLNMTDNPPLAIGAGAGCGGVLTRFR
jgi:hypothetical protein